MKTKAVRLYGKNDLRLEEFELPAIKDDEILMEVISDSICMSSYKAAIQGADHKRVPENISEDPVIIGHEFCGRILQVGEKWKALAEPGEKCAVQPAINYKGKLDAPGYSYRYCGGAATRIILPDELMEMGCLLAYGGKSYYKGSLAEPMSCIIRGFRENYHIDHRKGTHLMGIKEGGRTLILAGAGPMGLGAVDYALGSDRNPGLLAVVDIDRDRLDRAAGLFPSEKIPGNTRLNFINTAAMENPAEELIKLSGNQGWDDIFIMAPVPALIALADQILAKDGCMNFFAGPTRPDFSAPVNFYNIHYSGTHIIGSAGGNTKDMKEALDMMQTGRSNPSSMISHIGGLDAAADATLRLPEIPGGKKLIYTGIKMELTPLEGFRAESRGKPPLRQNCRCH